VSGGDFRGGFGQGIGQGIGCGTGCLLFVIVLMAGCVALFNRGSGSAEVTQPIDTPMPSPSILVTAAGPTASPSPSPSPSSPAPATPTLKPTTPLGKLTVGAFGPAVYTLARPGEEVDFAIVLSNPGKGPTDLASVEVRFLPTYPFADVLPLIGCRPTCRIEKDDLGYQVHWPGLKAGAPPRKYTLRFQAMARGDAAFGLIVYEGPSSDETSSTSANSRGYTTEEVVIY